jgi:hypothetical protein
MVADHASTAAEIRRRPIEVWTFDVGNETACFAQGDSSCGSGCVIASIRVRTELDCVWLFYRYRRSDELWKDEAYSIHIEWTACNYGGTRA